jgi:hypothetical protein
VACQPHVDGEGLGDTGDAELELLDHARVLFGRGGERVGGGGGRIASESRE